MDTAKVWFTLLCVHNLWTLTLAINCDLTTQYEYKGKCCQVCPLDEDPTQHCSESSDHMCIKCPAPPNNKRCFCEDKLLCGEDTCSMCVPRPMCKPGYQLRRTGNFDYRYYCEACPNKTYNDVEDGTCKPIAKCDGFKVIFAGNSTHNARCDIYEYSKDKQSTTSFNYIMMACLTIAVFVCLVLVLYTASLRFKQWRQKKYLFTVVQPCTHKVVLQSDACSCKLSKEEIGDKTESKVTSEILMFDGHEFP